MITIYYNMERHLLCDAEGNPISDLPEITFAQKTTWEIVLLNNNGEAFINEEIRAYRAAVGFDFSSETPVEIRTNGDQIRFSHNRIIVPLNANTNLFLDAVNGKEKSIAHFELSGLDKDGARIDSVSFRINARMSVDPSLDESIPEEVISQYLERSDVVALVNDSVINAVAQYKPAINTETGTWFVGDRDTGVKAQGPKGPKGDPGDPGKNGVSPEITAEITDTGLVLNITDVNGTQNFTLEGFYPRAGVIGVDDNGESVVNILGFETGTTNSFVDGTEPITTAYTFNAPDVVVDDDPDIVFRLPLKSTANPTLGSSVSHTDFIFESYNGKTCARFDGSQYGQYKTTRVHSQGHYTLFMNLAVQSIDSTTQANLENLAVLRNGSKYAHENDTQASAQSVKIGVMREAESGNLYLRATNGAGNLDGSDADTLLEQNQFYNVAMMFDGTQTKWFLNGSLLGSEENGLGRDADGSFNLCCLPEKYFGWSADFGMTFHINNIVEYAVALSDERIGELAAQYLNA